MGVVTFDGEKERFNMHTFRFASWWCVVVVAVALRVTVSAPASGQTTVLVIVPGYSDPWLAGMPDGATASCCFGGGGCDEAPSESPLLVPDLYLVAGTALTFEVTGATAPIAICRAYLKAMAAR